MAEHADTLIAHGHLFTMRGQGVGYVADGAVAIRGTRIAAVGPTAELGARFRADETIDASDCAVLPGLIDAHMHTHLAIVRGVAQDVAHWMQKGLSPFCAPHHARGPGRGGQKLNAVEALKAGTTTHGDYGGRLPRLGRVLCDAGRARLPDADLQCAAAGRHGRVEAG